MWALDSTVYRKGPMALTCGTIFLGSVIFMHCFVSDCKRNNHHCPMFFWFFFCQLLFTLYTLMFFALFLLLLGTFIYTVHFGFFGLVFSSFWELLFTLYTFFFLFSPLFFGKVLFTLGLVLFGFFSLSFSFPLWCTGCLFNLTAGRHETGGSRCPRTSEHYKSGSRAYS